MKIKEENIHITKSLSEIVNKLSPHPRLSHASVKKGEAALAQMKLIIKKSQEKNVTRGT